MSPSPAPASPVPTDPTPIPQGAPRGAALQPAPAAISPAPPASKAQRPPPLAAGVLLAGRFELVRRLGAGGLAEVWLARDRLLGAEVAIKALHAHLASDAGLCARFRRELAVTRGLDHPGIVKVFDLHEHGGRPFFAMELLRGRSLAEQLAEGPLPCAEALRLAREVAAALQAAHRQGVVHRDLKPQNIFLEARKGAEPGASPRAVLLDFGLARAAGWERLTAASAVMGTPGYIAPEVLQGAGADARADLYALGAVLFEALSGKRAFSSVDAYAVLGQKGAPPRLRDAAPGADADDEALVARLLAPDPEARFLDAGQVLRALGGDAVPEAPLAPPALTCGEHGVVVRSKLGFGGGRALARVFARLGYAKPPLALRARLLVAGKGLLVSDASRASAERVSALCCAEGLAAQVVPAKTRPGAMARLGLRARRVGAALTAGLAASTALEYARSVASEVARYTSFLVQKGHDGDLNRAKLALHPEWLQASYWWRSLAPYAGVELVRGAIFGALVAALLSQLRPAPIGGAPPADAGRLRSWGPALAVGAAFAAFLAFQGGTYWVRGAPLLVERFEINNIYTRQVPLLASLLPDSFHLPLNSGALLEGLRRFAAAGGPLAVAAMGLFAGALAWALGAPLRAAAGLPDGDPAVRRLAAGIARRVASLRARVSSARDADRAVAAELLEAAEAVTAEAGALADRAAREEDPLLAGARAATARAAGVRAAAARAGEAEASAHDEAATAPQGVTTRDRAIDRLLEMAAALDDALAVVAGGGAGARAKGREASASLLRLRADLAAAPPVASAVREAEPAAAVTPVDAHRRERS